MYRTLNDLDCCYDNWFVYHPKHCQHQICTLYFDHYAFLLPRQYTFILCLQHFKIFSHLSLLLKQIIEASLQGFIFLSRASLHTTCGFGFYLITLPRSLEHWGQLWNLGRYDSRKKLSTTNKIELELQNHSYFNGLWDLTIAFAQV